MTKKQVLTDIRPGMCVKVKMRTGIWDVLGVWGDGTVRLMCGFDSMLCTPRYIASIVSKEPENCSEQREVAVDVTAADKDTVRNHLIALLNEAQTACTDTTQIATYLIEHNVTVTAASLRT